MASAIVVIVDSNPSKDYSPLVLKLACTAHTDGTFDARQITTAEVGLIITLKAYTSMRPGQLIQRLGILQQLVL